MSRAVSIEPSGDFDGNDGKWSTFAIGIGTPSQTIKVLIATSGQETWAVTPNACEESDFHCRASRGHLYNMSSSQSWEEKGFYELFDQRNLGYKGEGLYGLDIVRMGWPGSNEEVVVQNSVVAGTASPDFYLGLFGISPRPTNFTDFNDQYPSFLTSLKEIGRISSLAYGYTAGASYRSAGKGVQGSLTLGGVDLSRFITTEGSIPLNPVTTRDIVAPLSLISTEAPYSTSATSSTSTILYRETIHMFVDAGTPHIWLPLEACNEFEKHFGLSYDNSSGLYLVNATQHEKLLAKNETVIFHLETVNIALPYSAFDLEVDSTYPRVTQKSRYFPLRRAVNSTQYTLGRTFLQEAYLMVDYERGNFSLHQVQWNETSGASSEKKIVPIEPPSNSTGGSPPEETKSSAPGSGRPVPTSTIVGCVVGGVVLLILLSALFAWRQREKVIRKRKAAQQTSHIEELVLGKVEIGGETITEADAPRFYPEMDAGLKPEMEGSNMVYELGGVNNMVELNAAQGEAAELPTTESRDSGMHT